MWDQDLQSFPCLREINATVGEKCNLIAKYEGGGMFRKQVNSL